MSSLYYNNKFILQFFIWIIHENGQTIKLALNESGNEEKEATDTSKELARPENLSYPLFLGLCCGKCGGNMPLNIPGGGTPEPHEF
ncbi:MAG: hypothetical protein ACYSR1_03700, partial [Planctomycetota bacterium]